MLLSDLNTHERAIIVRVHGRGSFRKRIIEMGFVKGKSVRVVLNAPLKDPVEYELLGYRVSLRREEAQLIEVVGEREAEEILQAQASSNDSLPFTPAALRATMREIAGEKRKVIRVALVGNPNCGKTTIFNIASGSHQRVGNYSGVTVEAMEGRFHHEGYTFILTDLPGTYSLSSYSPEEKYVRQQLITNVPDIVLNVVDASNIERNLYLTTQLIDLDCTMVIALNMYDEIQKLGIQIDYKQLGTLLGTVAVPTIGRTGTGVKNLFSTLIEVYEGRIPTRHIHIGNGSEVEYSIQQIKTIIHNYLQEKAKYSARYLAIKLLENDQEMQAFATHIDPSNAILQIADVEQKRLKNTLGENSETLIVDAKYGFINGAVKETIQRSSSPETKHTPTDRIDAILTHRYLGFPLFFIFLYLMFDATFVLGAYPMEWIDAAVSWLGEVISMHMPAGPLKDMLVDGIIGGVGSVIVFLPNILILYFFISIMEDTGYMARAAFIMDKLMHKMGLHGKSFIPMIMGFGCNVPAVMATRTIESRPSRLITMLVTPLMSCSARIPIYIVLIGAFFSAYQGILMLSLYMLGIVLAIICARLFKKFLIKSEDLPFVMELPPYRIPVASSVVRHTWEKGKQYLKKMGTIILLFSILIWFLGYYPNHDAYATHAAQQENSYIGKIGRTIEPVLAPLGFDWKMSIGILSGIGAKELVVSTLGVIYSGDASMDTAAENLADDTRLQRALSNAMTPQAALAYMVFVLLYIPCLATVVAIKNESGSWRWAIFAAVYTTGLAWCCAFVVYRIGLLVS